jgi:hypothetical protein
MALDPPAWSPRYSGKAKRQLCGLQVDEISLVRAGANNGLSVCPGRY